MCRRTFNVFFLVLGFTTGKVKIVVGDTPLLAVVAAAAAKDVRFHLPTEQVNTPPNAPIRAFLTRNILPGEEEPVVLRLVACVELRTVVHRDTVEVYLNDFQHT